MARSPEVESFRVIGQDSFDAYDTPFIGDRYPGSQGTLEIVAAPETGAPHGRCLRVTGTGSYIEDRFYWTSGPEYPAVYSRTNQLHRDLGSILVSVWLYIPAAAGSFTLLEVWGQDVDDRELIWTLCRLEAGGGGVTFEGGESLAGGGLPTDEWFQLQFRWSHYSGDAGEGQALNSCAVRMAMPGYEGTTLFGQDEADEGDGWQTVLTKRFDVPPFVEVGGLRLGMVPGGTGSSEGAILLDDYCVGTVDMRYEASQLYPPGLVCNWQDGLWVECCALTGVSDQGPSERTDPGGTPPFTAEGAPSGLEALDELPAHDGDLTRVTTEEAAAVEGYTHAPLTRTFEGFGERVFAIQAPVFGASTAGDESPRYCYSLCGATDNLLDQAAEEAEHYNPIVPPAHPEYGCGVSLWWGPQMENPVWDEPGTQEGQAWYYDGAEADATDVFLQAPQGHVITSLAIEISHTSEAILPPFPGPTGTAGTGTFVVWWP